MNTIVEITIYSLSIIMVFAAFFQLRKGETISLLLVMYSLYHFGTEIAFGITSFHGMNNWFLEQYVTKLEWTIHGLIFLFILNYKRIGWVVFFGYLVTLAICQAMTDDGSYWYVHLTSTVTLICSAFVWIYFLNNVSPVLLLKLKRFWLLLSITILQATSSFTILLYELIPIDQFDFLPSILIITFHISIILMYSFSLKACLCKEV